MGLISKKLQNVRISETAKIKNLVDEKISKGQKILGLSVGEPNFKTPENIVLAAKKAITNGFTKYTQTSGIPELKNAIITKYVKEKNLYYGSDQIIVSSGGKQVIFMNVAIIGSLIMLILFVWPFCLPLILVRI